MNKSQNLQNTNDIIIEREIQKRVIESIKNDVNEVIDRYIITIKNKDEEITNLKTKLILLNEINEITIQNKNNILTFRNSTIYSLNKQIEDLNKQIKDLIEENKKLKEEIKKI
jgi:hypothetical protein